MLRLSIIVPLCGPAESFEDTLVSVLQNRPHDCEVLVVTAGDYADPYDLVGEVEFIAASPAAPLFDQMNLAVSASRGEVVHVIHPGLVVEEGWTDPALVHFQDPSVGSVAPLLLDGARRRIVAAGLQASRTGKRRELFANVPLTARRLAARSLVHARCDGPTWRAGFWRKSAWDHAGGLAATFGAALADLDLALTLQSFGYRCVTENESRLTCIAAIHIDSPSAWNEGRAAEQLYWKHARKISGRGAPAIHLVDLCAELLGGFVQPRRAIEFLGRLSVLLGVGGTEETTSHDARAESRAPGALRWRDSTVRGSDPPHRPPARRNAVQPS